MNTRLYGILLLVSLLAGVAGILTLIPASGATYPNVLGYRSLCTFAPAASFYCFAIAGATCVVRASLVKRRAMFGKPVVRAPAVVVVGVVLALGILSTFWFVNVKSGYTDGESAATVSTRFEPPGGPR